MIGCAGDWVPHTALIHEGMTDRHSPINSEAMKVRKNIPVPQTTFTPTAANRELDIGVLVRAYRVIGHICRCIDSNVLILILI